MNSKLIPEVHWHEGMLLMPQHFQVFGNTVARRFEDLALTRGPWPWGVLDLQPELTGYELNVSACDILMSDGTRVVVPGNTKIERTFFQAEFDRSLKVKPLEVWLGIPDVQADVSVIDPLAGRYVVDTNLKLRDENSSDQQTSTNVDRRFFRGKLFFGEQSRDGYTTIKIAEIVRIDQHDPRPMISDDYVPPLLDVTANYGLRRRLGEIAESLRQVNQAVGADVAARPFSMLLQAGGSPEALFKLNATNALLPAVELHCRTKGVHPFHAYLTLSTLAGALAVFAPERTCPKIPAYDHLDLRACYDAVLRVVKDLLQRTWSRHWDLASFASTDNERELVCHRPKGWVGSTREQYLAIMSDMPPAELDVLVTNQVKLLGSADYKSGIRGMMVSGVRLRQPHKPPDKLPPLASGYYFLLDRKTSNPERLRIYDESEDVFLVSEKLPLSTIQVELYAIMEGTTS